MKGKTDYERPEAEALWVSTEADILQSQRGMTEKYEQTSSGGVWDDEDDY